MPDAPDPIALVAQSVLPEREKFIADLVAATEAGISALEHDETMRGLLLASVSENIVAVLNLLANALDPTAAAAPLSALSYARRLAQRDVPLAALLRAYRFGQSRFLHLCMEHAIRLGRDDTAQTMMALSDLTATYIDRVGELVSDAYVAERERWLQDRGVMRRNWVTQLLSAPGPNAVRAERALGYRLDRVHLGVEAWLQPDEVAREQLTTVFRSAVTRMAGVLDSQGAPLAVPSDEREMQIWIAPGPGIRPDAQALGDSLRTAKLPVRIAVGHPATGLDGFRMTMNGASRAKRLSISAGSRAPMTVSYDELAPVALLDGDSPDLGDFVRRTLAGLAVEDGRGEWLRETLLTFLRNKGSYADAARELHVHRNTVQYRVAQALEVYGMPLPADVLQLRLALEISRWRPELARP